MQTVSSYGVELRKQNIPIRQTLKVYRSAVSYLTEIYGQVWEELEGIPETKRRFNAAEHLVHTTKKNRARFEFDIRFPKMPSYLSHVRFTIAQHAGDNFPVCVHQFVGIIGQRSRFFHDILLTAPFELGICQ